MEKKYFMREVYDFCSSQIGYIRSMAIDWDFDDVYDPKATIHIVDHYNNKYDVPIVQIDYDHGSDIAIDIGDAGYLDADEAGLYCYLWHKAMFKDKN